MADLRIARGSRWKKRGSSGVVWTVTDRFTEGWGGYKVTVLTSPNGRKRRLHDSALTNEFEPIEEG